MQGRYAYSEVSRNEVKTHRKGGIPRKIALVVLIFMFIYTFEFDSEMPSLTSTRVACVAIFIWGFLSQERLFTIQIGNTNSERYFRRYLLVNLFLLFYTSFVLLLWGNGTGETVTNIYINILIFSLAFYYGCKFLFNDIDEFMQVVLIVTLLQCLIIFASLFSSEVYSWIRTSFYSNSYFELSGKLGTMKGYALGIGCFTSKGSQKLSLGVVACLYYILKKKKNSFYLVSMLIITLASTAVSRIGVAYTIIAILYLFLTAIKNAPKKAQSIIAKVSLLLLIGIGLVFVLNFQSILASVFWRLEILLQGGISEFFIAYFNGPSTVVPEISIETLIGTGIWSGTSGCGLTISADGGFARTYFSLGLIVAIGYYLFFLFGYLYGSKNTDKIERMVCIIFLIFILIGEFKEPLLFDWYYQTIAFVFMYVSEKNNDKLTQNTLDNNY